MINIIKNQKNVKKMLKKSPETSGRFGFRCFGHEFTSKSLCPQTDRRELNHTSETIYDMVN